MTEASSRGVSGVVTRSRREGGTSPLPEKPIPVGTHRKPNQTPMKVAHPQHNQLDVRAAAGTALHTTPPGVHTTYSWGALLSRAPE